MYCWLIDLIDNMHVIIVFPLWHVIANIPHMIITMIGAIKLIITYKSIQLSSCLRLANILYFTPILYSCAKVLTIYTHYSDDDPGRGMRATKYSTERLKLELGSDHSQ